MSLEKLQTMSMQNFWGVKEVHYGIVQVVNRNTSRSLGQGEMLWGQGPQASVSTAFSSSPELS